MRQSLPANEHLYPMPVLVVGTYDENGTPDAMVAAWGSVGDTKELFLCIDPSHKSSSNLQKTKAITVSPAPASRLKECDYLGLYSANNVTGKLDKVGFHVKKSEKVNAPIIAELPYTFECEVISYDNKVGHLFAKIINVSCDESILTNGKVDVKKLDPITFDPVNHQYIKLGEVAGKAFSDGKSIQ